MEAIISSMTPGERADYQIINGSRRRRIAQGSGTSVQDVNRLLKNFAMTQKMIKQMAQGGKKLKGQMPQVFLRGDRWNSCPGGESLGAGRLPSQPDQIRRRRKQH